ncbi:uncharacterized protein LOC120420211 [Culex pipiens pallens]|uniref:uncharacterized protein LOC120420211 n=1 Tax=Culex pipiens pallens TaxID=42434 RepID=UPI001954A2A7|nr:uncharacterized protein LOC120420211 [Culex pipiens pallens]
MVVTQEDKSIELLDVDPQETEDDGAVVVLDSKRKGKRIVIKTLTRQTYFLPVFGLVDPEKLKPGDLYSDIGGLDRQIQKLIEAVVLPTTHKDKFKNLRIHPPKSTYLKLAGHPNQLDTRVDTTIGLPAHIDSAGGLNPPLASNRTIFTGTSFSLATSPSIRSTSSISLLNREPSSSSSPFTNPELPITLPSSSPNVTLFPPTMVNVPSPSHVLCFLVVILPQHTCVVVEGNKQVTVLNCHYPH